MSRMNYTFVTDDVVPGVEKQRYIVSQTGEVYDLKLKHFVAKVNNNGYYRVYLRLEDGSRTHIEMHRLVKLQHHGSDPDPEKYVVDHKNCDKHDNYLSNLEFVTNSENVRRAINNNLYPEIYKVISDEDAELICKMLSEGYNFMQISDYFYPKYQRNINRIVERIYLGDAWKYISIKYMPFPKISPSNYKLNEQIVEEICQYLSQGIRQVDIAKIIFKKYNLDFNFPSLQKVISDIYNRKRWVKISSKYQF